MRIMSCKDVNERTQNRKRRRNRIMSRFYGKFELPQKPYYNAKPRAFASLCKLSPLQPKTELQLTIKYSALMEAAPHPTICPFLLSRIHYPSPALLCGVSSPATYITLTRTSQLSFFGIMSDVETSKKRKFAPFLLIFFHSLVLGN